MSEIDSGTKFNGNIKYFRYILDLTMAMLAQLISEYFKGKSLTVQQVQAYEMASEPRIKVLLAMRDYLKTKDSSITCDMLFERDFAAESYQFPDDPNQYVNNIENESSKLKVQIEKLEHANSELLSSIKDASKANLFTTELLNILTKKM